MRYARFAILLLANLIHLEIKSEGLQRLRSGADVVLLENILSNDEGDTDVVLHNEKSNPKK